MSFIDSVRIAALPFVTRSLRGQRGRRLALLAVVLAVINVVLGLWLAFGSGALERGIREDLRLEPSRFDRERREFVVVLNDDTEFAHAERARELMYQRGIASERNGVLGLRAVEGYMTLDAAVAAGTRGETGFAHQELLGRARTLLTALGDPGPVVGRVRVAGFDWTRGPDRMLLAQIVERGGVPAVERYASPLGGREAIGIVGLLAAAMLLALTTVLGPVMTGIAVAQESHDNTLQPIAGSALSARQIAIGLVLGASAPIAIVAAPQLLLVGTIGLLRGELLPLLGLLVLLAPCAFAVTMLSLAVGLFAGRRRSGGAIGITLLAGLGTWLCAGIPLGFHAFGRSESAAVTLLPSGGLVHFVRAAFIASEPIKHAQDLGWRMAAAAVASLVVGMLALRAAERRVPGRFVAPLQRGEALLGAGVLSALSLIALGHYPGPEVMLASLAIMVMPMQVLLMARVPAGDSPSGSGVPNLRGLLGEFAVYVGLHGALALVMVGPGFVLRGLGSVGVLHLAWALAISALVAIRIVAAPARLPASIFAGFAFVLAIVEFVTGSMQMLSSSRSISALPLWSVSPTLALGQLALLVVLPWTLVRGIRRAGTRAAPSGE
jgi:hypothetical protein